jgi:hypothetical protein
MNIQSRLDQFRSDNPFDVQTQAKRLHAANDEDLILYVLALGLTAAKHRQRHQERDYMKSYGAAPENERLVPGRVTGSVVVIPSKKTANAAKALILNVWRINGEQPLGDATGNDLAVAINRENASAKGHTKNAEFYIDLKKTVGPAERVHEKWDEKTIREEIKRVYGEFRKQEAA